MLALIATSFETREASARTVEIVEIDVPEIQPQMKAKKLEKDISLLEAVVLPPATQTKTAASPFKALNSQSPVQTLQKPSIAKPALALDDISPALSFAGKSAAARAGAPSGRGESQTALENGGANHCTLIAHIGPTARNIAQVEFIDCRNGAIASAAERELYHWVEQGTESFVALGAEAGDAVEFTYETKRR